MMGERVDIFQSIHLSMVRLQYLSPQEKTELERILEVSK